MLLGSQFQPVADLIQRVNPAAVGKLERLLEEVNDLLIAVGKTHDGSEYGKSFLEFAAIPVDHAAVAQSFAAIARSGNPLGHSLCSGAILAELYAAARRKWHRRVVGREGLEGRSRVLSSKTFLAECTPQELRELAHELAHHHKSFIRRQRPRKNALDTLLDQLGEIYACYTDFPRHQHELSHSVASRFVGFCRLILEPFFDPSEVSRKALANRWKRIKQHAKSLPVPIKRTPKRKARPKKRPARATA